MSYLLDKKIKRKRINKVALIVVILFVVFYFRTGILNILSSATHFVFRPVLVLGENIGNGFSNIRLILHNRKTLLIENENLKSQISESEADRANYASVVDENNKMKEILGRKGENQDFVLASILSKPNKSPYDTFVVDIGANSGVVVGEKVFALGNIPVGKIAEVYGDSSKIILYSSPGEKMDVIVSLRDVTMQLVGRGGGNFEMILPRDFVIEKGAEVVLPGFTSQVVGVVQTILSDPRDSYQKALLSSPVNIFQLKFVEVEK
jgi:cell shape-determining protein MreC